jgi:hypothetical protein
LPEAAAAEPRVRRNGLPRRARALLIAGDQPGVAGNPTPGALDALAVVERDLRSRFAGTGIELVALHGAPTRRAVRDALSQLQAITWRDDLLVVMFAGHGKAPAADQPAEAWSLTTDEVFTDIDLAAALLGFAAGVEIVAICACCYGEGFFVPGVPGVPGAAPPDRARPRLSPECPMVCISAASEIGQVTLTKLVELAQDTVNAAAAGQSYAELARAFAARRYTGREFHVDARPAERLADRVLAVTARAAEPDDPAPPSPLAIRV